MKPGSIYKNVVTRNNGGVAGQMTPVGCGEEQGGVKDRGGRGTIGQNTRYDGSRALLTNCDGIIATQMRGKHRIKTGLNLIFRVGAHAGGVCYPLGIVAEIKKISRLVVKTASVPNLIATGDYDVKIK